MNNCFAYNKKTKKCTCLKKEECAGQEECVFFKDAAQAKWQCVEGLRRHSPYREATLRIADMIDANQVDK